MKKCAICGHAGLTKGTTEHAVKVGVAVVTGVVPSVNCPKCGESYVDGPALEALELRVAHLVARSGRHDAGTFRFMRRALGMQSKALAEVLGVAPETITRWEREERPVDRFAWLTLAMLVADAAEGRKSTRDLLEATREPRPLPAKVA